MLEQRANPLARGAPYGGYLGRSGIGKKLWLNMGFRDFLKEGAI